MPRATSSRRTPSRPSAQERARRQVAKCLAASGLTQTTLGEQLTPPRQPAWVSRYLRGKIDADIDTLLQFAAIFKCTYDQLFGSSTDQADEQQSQAAALRARLDAAYATMTDAKRQLVVLMAESLAEPLVAPRRGQAERQRKE